MIFNEKASIGICEEAETVRATAKMKYSGPPPSFTGLIIIVRFAFSAKELIPGSTSVGGTEKPSVHATTRSVTMPIRLGVLDR